MYESEREYIEGMYWDARDQLRQRLLALVEERRRKLREEKEGGDIVTGAGSSNFRKLIPTDSLIEVQTRPHPRRLPYRARMGPSSSGSATPNLNNHSAESGQTSPKEGTKPNDILLHNMLAPALAIISTEDLMQNDSSSLEIKRLPTGFSTVASGKRGPRGKANDKDLDVGAAPGTSAALAIASGQAPAPTSGKRGAGAQSGWVLGKALNDMKRMEEASLLERDSDWARIQGSQAGRGRRGRGD